MLITIARLCRPTIFVWNLSLRVPVWLPLIFFPCFLFESFFQVFLALDPFSKFFCKCYKRGIEATSEGRMARTPTLSKGVWGSLSRSLSRALDRVMGRSLSLPTSDLAPIVLVTAAGFEPATPIGRRMTYHCTKWPDGRTFPRSSLPSTFPMADAIVCCIIWFQDVLNGRRW